VPSERPDVIVLLVHRLGPPAGREIAAWQEAAEAYPGDADIHHVWAGTGAVPAGMDLGTPAAAVDVLGLGQDAIVLVAEASAVPGPRLVQRLVDEALTSTDRVVDARVLPVELTRTDDRLRGYHLPDDADRDADLLEEERYPGAGEPGAEDEAEDEAEDGNEAGGSQEAEHGSEERDASRHVDSAVVGHEVLARDGAAVHPRVTGACCVTRARHLRALTDALLVEPSIASGAALVDAASLHGLEVDVAHTAAVALPVRLTWDAVADGRVPAHPRTHTAWPPTTHPAALPTSSLGRLVEQYGLPLPEDDNDPTPRGDDAPFLSIVTRTQGRRIHCLEDMFTCLAGQTDRDFEVLLMAHRVDAEHLAMVEDVVASLPAWLRDAVRVVAVERPGRAAPLNEGFGAARGHYIVALDDDDTVLSHYVSTFRSAAADHYGRLLRVVAVRQDIAPVGNLDTLCAVSVDDPFREWPLDFALIAHLTANHSPFMSIAFPRGAMHGLGMRFDETLDTTEDWDYIVRCAAALGVESIREITCVYRWWVHTGSSREVHSKAEWDEARLRVQRRFEESILLLQPGETERLVKSLQSTVRAAGKSHRLARKLATSQHETNLEMTKVFDAYQAAVAHRQSVETRLGEVRTQLKETRQKLQRRTKRLRLLEARVQVEERLRLGTLDTPEQPIADLTLAQLEALVRSPDTGSRWKRSLRSVGARAGGGGR
jgi:hypothetical protein